MLQNYFIVNGERHYTGTIFVVKNMGQQIEVSFVCYDLERERYIYKMKDHIWSVDEKNFQRLFVCLTDKIDASVTGPTIKTKKDMQIDGLFLGWMWYIFLMAISVIFKDAIGLWILISVIFFSWRAKKIKEEGTYIEW